MTIINIHTLFCVYPITDFKIKYYKCKLITILFYLRIEKLSTSIVLVDNCDLFNLERNH